MSEFKYIKKKIILYTCLAIIISTLPVVYERFLLCANVLIVFSFPSDFFPSLHSEAVWPGLYLPLLLKRKKEKKKKKKGIMSEHREA